METLRDKRVRFTRAVARLIDKAVELGYQPALAEVLRGQVQAIAYAQSGKGTMNSLHISGLAVDLILYAADGTYLEMSEDYHALGQWWKTLGADFRWGGDFRDSKGRPKPDGNHFSITPDGVRA